MSVKKKSQFKSIALKLAAGGLTVIVAGLVYLQGTPKVYRATAKVKIVKSGWNTNDANFSFGPEKLPEECRIIRSDKLLDRVITNLDLNAVWGKQFNQGIPLKIEQTRQRLRTMLDAHPVPKEIVIEIQASGDNPDDLAKLVNEVTRVYGDFRQAGREEASRQGISALRTQWETQSQKVQEAQAALDKLSDEFNKERANVEIFDPGAVRALEAQKLTLEDDYLQKSNEFARLKEIDKSNLKDVLSSMDTNSVLAGVLQQLIKAKSNLRGVQLTRGADATETKSATLAVEELERKVDGLVASMMSMRELELTSLKTRLENVKVTADKAARSVNNETNTARFAEQDATFARAKEKLTKLVEERDALESEIINYGSMSAVMPDAISARIVELADPSAKPISPDRRIAIGAFVVGGTVMGAGILLLVLLQMKPRGAEEKTA